MLKKMKRCWNEQVTESQIGKPKNLPGSLQRGSYTLRRTPKPRSKSSAHLQRWLNFQADVLSQWGKGTLILGIKTSRKMPPESCKTPESSGDQLSWFLLMEGFPGMWDFLC